MDDTELQLRLSACRPHGQDSDDALMSEALEKLPQRPHLAAWFQEEQAFDAALGAHVRQMAVPESLRAEILAAAKVSSTELPQWQRLPWLAAAAVVLLGVSAFLFQTPTQTASVATLAEFQTDIVGMFDRIKSEGVPLDHQSGEISNVSTWLGEHRAPKPYALQSGMKSAHPMGCRIVTWRGCKVTMVCFGRGDQEAHLFVIDRADLESAPDVPRPEGTERQAGYPVAHWTCRKCVYVIVGSSEKTDLSQFL